MCAMILNLDNKGRIFLGPRMSYELLATMYTIFQAPMLLL
jgi:hypothetical protein